VGGLVWWQNNSKIADDHHFEIYRHISAKNHPIVIKYYTAADFELGERHVIKKNEKLALDRLRLRQYVFLFLQTAK